MNWQKLFDWSIKEVTEPAYVWRGIKMGYEVVVVYNQHGTKKKFFDLMDASLCSKYGHPQFAAAAYYRKMKRKQARRQKNVQKTR